LEKEKRNNLRIKITFKLNEFTFTGKTYFNVLILYQTRENFIRHQHRSVAKLLETVELFTMAQEATA
jgi:hypothetical protein